LHMEASQHSLLAACFTLHSRNATLAIVPQRGAGLWMACFINKLGLQKICLPNIMYFLEVVSFLRFCLLFSFSFHSFFDFLLSLPPFLAEYKVQYETFSQRWSAFQFHNSCWKCVYYSGKSLYQRICTITYSLQTHTQTRTYTRWLVALFIPVAPIWSIGHPWNTSIHFSFVI
jgi:hypothetical protein